MAATMDDLIASLSGGMHVSQDGYDIKALQEYLYQTMHMPNFPHHPHAGPSGAYRAGPASRSASLTRKPTSLPSSYSYESAFPSPLPQSAFNPFPDLGDNNGSGAGGGSMAGGPSQLAVALPTPMGGRPAALRRSSSYGFGGVVGSAPASPAASYKAFEADAFAPVWQEQLQAQAQAAHDPWARLRSQQQQSAAFPQHNTYQSPWGQAAGPSHHANTGFGFRQAQQFDQSQDFPQHHTPTPPAEDDEEMDEDMIDAEMDDEEEEERVERVMGLSGMDGGDENVGADENNAWMRGRRKY